MHAVRVALSIPAEKLHPMHEFVCESSAIERQAILERDTRDEVTTLLLHVDGDREGYERALSALPQAEEWTTEPAEEGFYVYVRTELRDRERRYSEALDRESVLIVPPVELRPDRTVRQTMVGRAAEVSAAVEALPSSVDVEVLRTGTYGRVARPATTERQREALRAAREVGYYDVPRSAGLSSVAERLDCSESAASELLRRAERRLVEATLDGGP